MSENIIRRKVPEEPAPSAKLESDPERENVNPTVDTQGLLEQLSKETDPDAIKRQIMEFLGSSPTDTNIFLENSGTGQPRQYQAEKQLALVEQVLKIQDISKAQGSSEYRNLAPGLQRAVCRYLVLSDLKRTFGEIAQPAPEPQSQSDPQPMSHLLLIIKYLEYPAVLAGDYLTWQIGSSEKITVTHTIEVIRQMMKAINQGHYEYALASLGQITRNLNLREAVGAVYRRQIEAILRQQEKEKEEARQWLSRLSIANPWMRPFLQAQLTKKRYDELIGLARKFFVGNNEIYGQLLPLKLKRAGLLPPEIEDEIPTEQPSSTLKPKNYMGRLREVFRPSLRELVQETDTIQALTNLINQPKYRKLLEKEGRDVSRVIKAINAMKDYFMLNRTELPIADRLVRIDQLQVDDLQRFGITDSHGIATKVLELLRAKKYS